MLAIFGRVDLGVVDLGEPLPLSLRNVYGDAHQFFTNMALRFLAWALTEKPL